MGGIGIQGTSAVNNFDNAFRTLMAQIADWTDAFSLASGSTTDLSSVPGMFVTISGNATITSFGTAKAGWLKFLRFSGTPQITYNATSMILPKAASITATAGDTAIFVSEGSGNWRCISYSSEVDATIDPWAVQPLGSIHEVNLGISGFNPAPPKDKAYRYILLTAGQTGTGAYNEGVLTSEVVTGSSPNIDADAVVSLAGSPLNGKTVRLINTTREFLRPGSAGTKQSSQNILHGHGVNENPHSHVMQNPSNNSQIFVYAGNSPGSNGDQIGLGGQGGLASGNPIRPATTGITIQSSGGDEARSRNIGVDYYMRIK
ncbi:hypothetical protein [Rhizobium rhizogenes]|uniref:hypothetical protein n=1 Tax=Rhizobium rhizogenes TaxID=359 RepID=UPI0022CCF68F|nr:hypothetical protein [Rhizobium rhizogenes]MCZ7480565.1 hypothetical protein [Rhizobium rhizogenes]